MTAGMITQFNTISNVKPIATATSSESGNNFLEVFKASADKTAETKNQDQAEKIKTKKTDKSEEKSEEFITNDFGEKASADETKAEEKDTSKEDVDAALEAAESIAGTIAQVLEVEPQMVTEALENMGLEEIDLLDSSNIPKVVVEISGAEDVVDIMTDEALFADVKDITEAAQEVIENLADELDVDASEVKDAVKDIIAKVDESVVTENEPEVVAMEETGREKSSDNADTAGNQMSFAESFIENVKAAVSREGDTPIAEYTTDMNEIYNQVSESLKVNMTEEVTEMEMNLHPASLGNVKVQIAERDGMITANFTTQNEQVKAALETQILELKENMNAQGIKVESIEVTLASHAFEENLSKEGGHTSSEGETKKKRRNINLNEIEESDDINIEDDIRIAREMMMHNGTTVDYMA